MQPQTRATVQQIYSACFMSLMQNRTIPLLHAGKLLIVRELVLLFFKKKYYYLFNIFSWVSQETTEIELWVRIKRRGSNLSFFLFLFFFLFQQKKKKKSRINISLSWHWTQSDLVIIQDLLHSELSNPNQIFAGDDIFE